LHESAALVDDPSLSPANHNMAAQYQVWPPVLDRQLHTHRLHGRKTAVDWTPSAELRREATKLPFPSALGAPLPCVQSWVFVLTRPAGAFYLSFAEFPPSSAKR